MIINNKVIFVIFFFIFSLIGASNIYAFNDDFTTNPIVNTNWAVHYPQGVTFNNPGVTLSSYGSNQYPYISTTLDLSSNKYFEIDFQFLEASQWGVAGVFTDRIPAYGPILTTVQDYVNNTIASVWGSTLLIQSTICPDNVAQCLSGRWTLYPNTLPIYENTSAGISDLVRHVFSTERINLPNLTYQYKVYLDKKLISTTVPTNRLINSIWIGNPQILGNTSNWPKMKLYAVRSLPENPISAPTFPYFSQLDSRWKNEEYDTAGKWAGIDKYGIGRWGCALTSATMVLQKNGVKALDGTDIDPSKLNTWLKSQPDGYVGLGYLNWVAITRYTRLSYEASHSPTKLEFTRTGAVTFPSIIGLPGHFVVVHGEDGSNWLVNDPASNTITTLPKSTALSSVNTFVPSMTDLSYMMFSKAPAVKVKISKEHGRDLNIEWEDEQITDQQTGDTGPVNNVGLVSKPKSGEYELKVSNSSDTPSVFDIYLYDKFGNPYIKKLIIGKKSNVKFEIKYNKDKLDKIKIEHEKRYRYQWNSKKKWFDKIWDEFDKWDERLRD